jgi:hypothetical protein
MGIEIPPGSDFVVSIHYAPGHMGAVDSTKVYLKWTDVPDVRPITNSRWLHWHVPSLINPPFFMPANTVTTFYEESVPFIEDKSLVALQPHMHLIGKSFKVFMVIAPGDTTALIYIPDWNFYWQLGYFLPKVMKLPVGAQIFGTAVFDNTTNNPNNPSNPPIDVSAGESTFDEMMSCRFWKMDYQAGDENIILDSSFYFTSSGNQILLGNLQVKVIPNPANNMLHFITFLPEHDVSWSLTNPIGMIVRTGHEKNIPKGMFDGQIELEGLPTGFYTLTVQSGKDRTVARIVVEN